MTDTNNDETKSIKNEKTFIELERAAADILEDVHQQAVQFLQQFPRPPQPLPELDERTKQILWRDFWFLVIALISLSVIGFVESHASEPQARHVPGGEAAAAALTQQNPYGIVDTGYILTQPLFEWLQANRQWNDIFAALNSIVLIPPSIYIGYTTVWKGDYSLIFRVLAVQLLRSFCGWFTYLPPVPEYLSSYYDFPDFVHCLFQECSGQPKAMPFVSFFSGHVATMVVAANHMWLRNFTTLALLHHFFNILQMIRLLATRGHYSIDIIIGWYVAIYLSVPAGRLGRYYSREGLTREAITELMPPNATDAFEQMTGVRAIKRERRMSALMKRPEFQKLLLELEEQEEEETSPNDMNDDDTISSIRLGDIQTETIAKLLHERATTMLEQAKILRERLHERVQQERAKLAAAASKTDETKKDN